MASGDIDAALRFCVENKLNMIVSGGTSTGKTVAARKILSLIPPEERIITIEEAAELRPEQPNAVTLIADRDTDARSADVLLASTPTHAAGPDRTGRGPGPRGHDLPRSDQTPGMAARSPRCMPKHRNSPSVASPSRRSRPTCR